MFNLGQKITHKVSNQEAIIVKVAEAEEGKDKMFWLSSSANNIWEEKAEFTEQAYDLVE